MRKKRLFFLHIEKTGGTSIEYALRSHFAEEDVCPNYDSSDWHKVAGSEELSPYKLFIGNSIIDIQKMLPKKTLTTTLMRHPVDHCISIYNHLRLRPDSKKYAEFEEKNMDFDRYLDEVLPTDPNLGRFSQCLQLVPREELNKLDIDVNNLREVDVPIIHTASYHLQMFDVVGFTDYLQDFYDRICEKMGWKTQDIPWLNTSKARDAGNGLAMYKEQLTDQQMEKIEKIYRPELELYDFARRMINSVVRGERNERGYLIVP